MTKRKSLLYFSALNYVDKFISLISPLIILKLFHNNDLYNQVEYILSISIILGSLLDFGLSKYFFYGYRNDEDKNKFVKEIETGYLIMFALQTAIVVIALIIYPFASYEIIIVWSCILIRGIFLAFTNFKLNIYRLTDNAAKIFYISIPVSIISIIILVAAYHHSKNVGFYFMGIFIFELLYIIYHFRNFKQRSISWDTMKGLMVSSFKFAWPTVINTFVLSYVLNYGKIYAYNYMSKDNMTTLALMQRFMVVTLLAHSSAAAFFTKEIFAEGEIVLGWKLVRSYTEIMIGSIVMLVAGVWVNNFFHFVTQVQLNATFFLLLAFYVSNCYSAFIGTYFSVLNTNATRLMGCIIMAVIFFGAIWIIRPQTTLSLSATMAVVMFMYLGFIIVYLQRKGVIRL